MDFPAMFDYPAAGRGEGYDVDYLFGQVEIKDPWPMASRGNAVRSWEKMVKQGC